MTIDRPTPDLLPSMRTLWLEAFGDEDGFLDTFMKIAYDPKRARVLAEDGEALAALYWMDASVNGQPLAYLYAVATRASHRGQGLAHRLLEDTHAHLASLGYAGAILVPSEPSLFGFYARFGYAPCAPMQTLVCEAAGEPLSLHRVSGEEYARLRENLLPRGGVYQGEAAMRLLEATATLYAGEELLVALTAVIKEGEHVAATELLGDVSLAPRVLQTLGAKEGHFRVAGGDRPFAMVRDLTSNPLPTPQYFALAFD